MARSRSRHDSNPTSDCVVAAQYQPGKCRLPAVRREPPYWEHRLERNTGHRLQHRLAQPAAVTISPLDIDQAQIHR
ncbi:hypothetical protein YW3DRAFT_07416, partial [Streptomyces sp. MnatMP-M77]|uniref:hypothetical protein n=1 Tax=unclassified Streptomyces TaxID=2593676 RepID=UPI000805D85B